MPKIMQIKSVSRTGVHIDLWSLLQQKSHAHGLCCLSFAGVTEATSKQTMLYAIVEHAYGLAAENSRVLCSSPRVTNLVTVDLQQLPPYAGAHQQHRSAMRSDIW